MMKIKNAQLASKRMLNLVIDEKQHTSPARVAAYAAVAVLALALVGKFGVYDRLQAVTAAQNALNDVQDQYLTLLAQDADYDDVLAEYNRYSFGGMTDEEKAVADRDKVLTLIETDLIPSASVESASLSGNQLSVQMSGINLQQASAIVQTLNADELVSSVAVYTASTDTDTGAAADDAARAATVTMVITLADNPEAAATSSDTAAGGTADSAASAASAS